MANWFRGHRRVLIAASTLLLTLAAIFLPLPFAAPGAQARTIDVDARQFAFEPSQIHVQQGDTVTIHLESLDAVHGLYIDDYGVDLHAEPGASAETTFVADHAGKFKVRCSVSCGVLHPFMTGEITVDPDMPFARAAVAVIVAAIGAVVYFWRNQ